MTPILIKYMTTNIQNQLNLYKYLWQTESLKIKAVFRQLMNQFPQQTLVQHCQTQSQALNDQSNFICSIGQKV